MWNVSYDRLHEEIVSERIAIQKYRDEADSLYIRAAQERVQAEEVEGTAKAQIRTVEAQRLELAKERKQLYEERQATAKTISMVKVIEPQLSQTSFRNSELTTSRTLRVSDLQREPPKRKRQHQHLSQSQSRGNSFYRSQLTKWNKQREETMEILASSFKEWRLTRMFIKAENNHLFLSPCPPKKKLHPFTLRIVARLPWRVPEVKSKRTRWEIFRLRSFLV